jgi:hypothetical protein
MEAKEEPPQEKIVIDSFFVGGDRNYPEVQEFQSEEKQIKEHFKTTQQNNINKTEDREEGVETLEIKTKL